MPCSTSPSFYRVVLSAPWASDDEIRSWVMRHGVPVLGAGKADPAVPTVPRERIDVPRVAAPVVANETIVKNQVVANALAFVTHSMNLSNTSSIREDDRGSIIHMFSLL